MSKRPIPEAYDRWLRQEAEGWRADGILNEVQVESILDRYELQPEASERSPQIGVDGQARAIQTLRSVAALLVGLAALLLVGYNWDAMPAALKLAIIFGTVVGTHAAALHLRFRRNSGPSSEVAFFLGCLFYGAGIWLVAQIFHLNAHYPDGVWFWALGVLPFALCLDTMLLHLFLVALLGIWAGMEVLGFNNLGASWLFGRWNYLPNGAYSLLALAAPGVLWAYRKNSPGTASLYILLLVWWVVLQPFAWRLEDNPTYYIGAVGALLLVIAEGHPRGSSFAVAFRFWGFLLVGGVLFLLSFYEFNRLQIEHGKGTGAILQTVAIVVLTVLTSVGTALAQPSLEGKPQSFARRFAMVAQRQIVPYLLILLMFLLGPWETYARSMDRWRAAAVPTTVVANLALLACCYWLVSMGLKENRGRQFSAGVSLFLVWAMVRYFDLFGDFGGMPGAALMFLLCGAALYGFATYWKNRSEVRHG